MQPPSRRLIRITQFRGISRRSVTVITVGVIHALPGVTPVAACCGAGNIRRFPLERPSESAHSQAAVGTIRKQRDNKERCSAATAGYLTPDNSLEQIRIMSPLLALPITTRAENCVQLQKNIWRRLYISLQSCRIKAQSIKGYTFYERCPTARHKVEPASFQRILPFMGDEQEY